LFLQGYGVEAYVARRGQATHFEQVAKGKSLRI
jgi:hypothetical protein